MNTILVHFIFSEPPSIPYFLIHSNVTFDSQQTAFPSTFFFFFWILLCFSFCNHIHLQPMLFLLLLHAFRFVLNVFTALHCCLLTELFSICRFKQASLFASWLCITFPPQNLSTFIALYVPFTCFDNTPPSSHIVSKNFFEAELEALNDKDIFLFFHYLSL